MREIAIESVLTCPECGFQSRETMPTSTCQIVIHCGNCGASLRAKDGDCCVFCSYGSIPCPSIQERDNLARAQPQG